MVKEADFCDVVSFQGRYVEVEYVAQALEPGEIADIIVTKVWEQRDGQRAAEIGLTLLERSALASLLHQQREGEILEVLDAKFRNPVEPGLPEIDRLRAALREAKTEDGAACFRSPAGMRRRLMAINELVESALAEEIKRSPVPAGQRMAG